MNLIDKQNSLVIDVTYNCNAKCIYCQWGNDKTSGRVNQPDNYIYISKDTLRHLKTQRIIFSGGEPLLRKDLEQIISYYRNKVQSIIILTNGFLLTEKRLRKLVDSGLTGITFSIDSFENHIAFETRAYSKQQVEKVKANFIRTCLLKSKLNIEIGINVVVSAANIKNNQIENFIDFLNLFSLDWIKFQPIFDDDDYVNVNAPHLLLSSVHSKIIRTIGKNILNRTTIKTNSINFWKSLSDILDGKKLQGESCDLASRQAIAQRGKIKICSWIGFPTYDITKRPISETQREFEIIKTTCKTGTFCYCLQNLSHTWKII
ncbi:MAG: radical SAM protein [Bacteroidales bacterium]|nr:radical SAM protein [Bacteroidales bacterium]